MFTKILLNNGHPIASIDHLALEIEGAAGALETLSMLVRPIDPVMCGWRECNITPDEEQISEHFRCIEATLRRAAVDLSIYHEAESKEKEQAAERIRHLPVLDPNHENYIPDSEIEEMIAERWGKDWDLRTVDPEDRWVKEYIRRIAIRSFKKIKGGSKND